MPDSNRLGRWSQLSRVPEVRQLRRGMDFRLPQYRREVFLRFYTFNLKYRIQPGCVHYVIPHIIAKHGLSREDALWFNFLCMSPGNLITGYTFFRRWPSFKTANWTAMKKFFEKNYDKLGWDTDRRWEKNNWPQLLDCYKALINKYGSQSAYYDAVYERAKNGGAGERTRNFEAAWKDVRRDFQGFGRMTTYSFLERLRIAGEPLECPSLYLEERSGSKAHRNGLLKVLGRDDLDWHKSNPDFDGRYSNEMIDWLTDEGAQLLAEARKRVPLKQQRDATYLTLESTFCTYKSWFRRNRRYPNVYNDWMLNQIRLAERLGDDLSIFYEARQKHVPRHLRAEDVPGDPGYCTAKQNWFLDTGQVINMDHDWPEFANDFAATHFGRS